MKKKLTGKDIWEEYQKLPESEKIKFETFRIKSKEELKLEQTQKRKEILENLMNIVREDGTPYFYREYLEKNILKK